MSLATCVNNKPWVCEVHFAYDQDLNVYFRSKVNSRHSKEITKNPNVSGNMITQHFKDQKVRGVYFEGTAQLLENVTEDDGAYLSFKKRYGMGKDALEDASKDTGHKFYKVTIKNWALFDSYKTSPSKKFILAWNK